MIPTFTPEEAVAELDHAVGTLGLKAVVMNGVIPRATRPDGSPGAWVDTLGHGSAYDYDPLWARCAELGVAPAFHGVGYGWGSRVSASNYVYNHLGNFAAAQEAACRSLLMGGVTRRFPDLHFAFLEGGVAWAAQLYADLLGHFEKRNADVVGQFDPRRFDLDLCAQAPRRVRDRPHRRSARPLRAQRGEGPGRGTVGHARVRRLRRVAAHRSRRRSSTSSPASSTSAARPTTRSTPSPSTRGSSLAARD